MRKATVNARRKAKPIKACKHKRVLCSEPNFPQVPGLIASHVDRVRIKGYRLRGHSSSIFLSFL